MLAFQQVANGTPAATSRCPLKPAQLHNLSQPEKLWGFCLFVFVCFELAACSYLATALCCLNV